MSIKSIRDYIEAFILNNENDLLIIKGSWGVGKTHTWREILREAGKKKTIGKQNYAYVSLFGLDSLDAIKEKLLVAFVDSSKAHQDGKRARVENYAGKLLTEGLKMDWAKKLTGNILQTIVFESMSEGLICFDDVERRGKNLEINQLFGFADLLKEQRNCKVVFILNDSKLDDRKEYDTQKEKITGHELEFSISPEEAFSLVFANTYSHFDCIKRCCLLLDIRNIRTLHRIDSFVKSALRELRKKEERAIEIVIRSLILFVWSYYDKEEDSVSLDAIRNHKLGGVKAKVLGKKEITAEEKKLEELLNSYGRWFMTEIDVPLMAFVEEGFLNTEAFQIEFKKLNNRETARRGNDEYSKAWELYGQTLSSTKEQFVESLMTGFEKNIKYIEVSSLDRSVWVLRGLREGDNADFMIDKYLATHRTIFTPEFERTIFFSNLEDSKLKTEIKAIIDSYNYSFEFDKTLERVTIERYPTPAELAFLDSKGVSDFVTYFTSHNSDFLYYHIKGCLDLEELTDPAGYRKSISDKTKEALRIIVKDDDFNKFKLAEWFGGRF